MTKWQRVTKAQPCPICGKPDWCSLALDGKVVYCMRVESNEKSRAQVGGWIHPLDDTLQQSIASTTRSKTRPNDTVLNVEWAPVARNAARNTLRIKKLSVELGVTQEALERLTVGYTTIKGTWCYTFPEKNALNQIVGINLRMESGKKLMVTGCRRGLYYANDWRNGNGTIYIVEGGSDTAAMLSMGLRAVGRPQCMPGRKCMNDLTRLLMTSSGPICVMGERDRKAHEDLPERARSQHKPSCKGCAQCWPGRHGAKETAEKLRHRLRRRKVRWSLPPGQAKDVRAWLNDQDCEPLEAGKLFSRRIR